MAEAIDLKDTNDLGKVFTDTAARQWVSGRVHDPRLENLRPINVQIVIDADRSAWFDHGNQWGFRFHRTRPFWVVVLLLLALGTTYARTRYICQSFKNEGRFYYGMDVDRCVGVLMKEPLASIKKHLATLDASY